MATVNYFPLPRQPGEFRVASATLTDASVTIQPFTDKCSKYILPSGTLTANRILTLGVTSAVTSDIIQIVVLDISAHTYRINDDAGTQLVLKGASPGQAHTYQFYYNGGTGHFIANVQWWTDN